MSDTNDPTGTRNPLVAAMCDGATFEEALEVLEALQESFDERVSEAQYHPHDEKRAARLEAVRSILQRMERAAPEPSWKEVIGS